MVHSGDVLDIRPLGMVFRFEKTAAETDGRSVEIVWELRPGAEGTPVHTHPIATESYEVLEGEMDVYVDGAWRTLREGESLSVPPNVPHTFRNSSDGIARIYNTHAPALRMAEFFADVERLASSGVQLMSDDMKPKDMLYNAVLATSYPEEIQLLSPPPPVLRLAGGLGRLLGYRV